MFTKDVKRYQRTSGVTNGESVMCTIRKSLQVTPHSQVLSNGLYKTSSRAQQNHKIAFNGTARLYKRKKQNSYRYAIKTRKADVPSKILSHALHEISKLSPKPSLRPKYFLRPKRIHSQSFHSGTAHPGQSKCQKAPRSTHSRSQHC